MTHVTAAVGSINRAIKSFPRGTRFCLDSFMIACPFTLNEILVRDRSSEIKEWRQLYLVWHVIGTKHLSNTARDCNMNHSTINYCLKLVSMVNENPKYYPSMSAKIESIISLSPDDTIKKRVDCIGTNEVNCLIHLEKLIQARL